VELCSRSTEPRFLDREARLLIWVRRRNVSDKEGSSWCNSTNLGDRSRVGVGWLMSGTADGERKTRTLGGDGCLGSD
jgi:hypothetical protein